MLNYTPYNRVDTYTNLLNTLSRLEKVELIKKIADSLKEDTIDAEKMEREKSFFSSFGAFSSEQTAEEIITDIKESRSFRNRDLSLEL
ncbi:hypothetical protein JMN10_02250 [Capnocytophaga genosp. AHN8471]|uniref:Uncharacterized protein n=2 Tax=Capnocytophaga TaxID=1016 RepID=A0A1Z4BK53_9FLAO|nr:MULTISPECIES: hypothetical protein [Capnocytophaga]ASF41632.1 hypothetical protein CBG49_00210 [Capnocytophaga endodontalis]MBM0650427.1 hypothetical protein [Capnocytophaga genosp. AHN8471]MBM0661009.1 hypothetical protein [Capnocytophaga genosp. AHN8471]